MLKKLFGCIENESALAVLLPLINPNGQVCVIVTAF
jgi:hypothetical protein